MKKLIASIRQIAADTQQSRESGSVVSHRPFIILIVVSCSLIIIEYIGKSPGHYLLQKLAIQAGWDQLAGFLKYTMNESPNRQLYQLMYWASIIFFSYFVIPVVVIRFGFREKLRDYGLQWGSFFKDAWIYLLMLGIMFPLVYFASTTTSFQARYPFYTPDTAEPLWPNFWLWQMTYLIQFFSLEFFFRGFMVHGLKKFTGFYSILIMTVPYCMIHFGKPMGETFAAIFAGIALGTMSLKSRSIALGVVLHYSVAITMDMAALWQEGYFD